MKFNKGAFCWSVSCDYIVIHGTNKNIEFVNCVDVYQNCLLDLVGLRLLDLVGLRCIIRHRYMLLDLVGLPCIRHRYMLLDLVGLPCIGHRYMCLLHIYFCFLTFFLSFFYLSFFISSSVCNRRESLDSIPSPITVHTLFLTNTLFTRNVFLKTNSLFFHRVG